MLLMILKPLLAPTFRPAYNPHSHDRSYKQHVCYMGHSTYTTQNCHMWRTSTYTTQNDPHPGQQAFWCMPIFAVYLLARPGPFGCCFICKSHRKQLCTNNGYTQKTMLPCRGRFWAVVYTFVYIDVYIEMYDGPPHVIQIRWCKLVSTNCIARASTSSSIAFVCLMSQPQKYEIVIT
jgi:hypothetical protein